MSDIQQARDVLAKWRDAATPGAWHVEHHRIDIELVPAVFADEPEALVIEPDGVGPDDARLIVGTAGNPDLLDALDGLLAAAIWTMTTAGVFYESTELIAAAIIAADERMTS